MFLLNTTMLREKFIIREDGRKEPMIALGNRITLPLLSRDKRREERLIVRGHNMHTTLRMAAMICKTFYADGPILTRSPSYPWGPNWDATIPSYERETNPDSWIAVYHGGRPIYKQGEYHQFLDVIEQCDGRNRDEYDRAVSIAENAFNIAGKGVKIDHQTTIALVIGSMIDKARTGLIFRNPGHSATFNFSVEPKRKSITKNTPPMATPAQCLLHAATWLELVQLSVKLGFLKAKASSGMAKRTSHSIEERLGRLNADLSQFEESFDVSYRPERPDMMSLVEEAHIYGETHKGIYQS